MPTGQCAAKAGEKYVADYLRIGVGARPLALGSASVAVLNETCAFYWNPAGVSIVPGKTAHLEYTSAFGGFAAGAGELHVAAFTFSIDQHAGLSLAYLRFTVDDIPRYPELPGGSFAERLLDPSLRACGKALGYFNDREEALFVSFARAFAFHYRVSWLAEELTFRIPVGISFKHLQQKLDTHDASGIGIDLGGAIQVDLSQFGKQTWLGQLCLAWQRKDMTNTTLTWENRKRQSVDPESIWGISYCFRVRPRLRVLTAWEESTEGDSGDRFGAEVAYGPLALRAGKRGRWPSFGVGLQFSRFRVDYAANLADLGNIHRVSLECTL